MQQDRCTGHCCRAFNIGSREHLKVRYQRSNSIDKLHQVIRETQLVDVIDGAAQSSVDHGKPTAPGVDADLVF